MQTEFAYWQNQRATIKHILPTSATRIIENLGTTIKLTSNPILLKNGNDSTLIFMFSKKGCWGNWPSDIRGSLKRVLERAGCKGSIGIENVGPAPHRVVTMTRTKEQARAEMSLKKVLKAVQEDRFK